MDKQHIAAELLKQATPIEPGEFSETGAMRGRGFTPAENTVKITHTEPYPVKHVLPETGSRPFEIPDFTILSAAHSEPPVRLGSVEKNLRGAYLGSAGSNISDGEHGKHITTTFLFDKSALERAAGISAEDKAVSR